MIDRRNIIQLLDDRSNVYHSAILTCYSFDPIFFESVFLSVLRRLGITNILVLMDASKYDALLADEGYKSHQVNTSGYSLVRMSNNHGGVFHPKMTLLFGADEGALIIGSGNITFSGLVNNDEVWNAFHISGNVSPNYPLLYHAWEYVQLLMEGASTLQAKQMGWIKEQCEWLQREATEESVLLQNGEEAILLYNSTDSSIIDKLVAEVGDAKVKEITMIAPFYDAEGKILKELSRRFNHHKMKCVLDLNRQSAPYALLHSDSAGNFSFFQYKSDHPLHAKILEIQTDKGTWLLSGSANASSSAFGLFSTFNDEVCVLLHSNEEKNYISELGLKDFILPIEKKQQKDIIQPVLSQESVSAIKVLLTSCEQKEDGVYLRFSKERIIGKLAFLNNNLKEIYVLTIATANELVVEAEAEEFHLVVLKEEGMEVSNRCLVIKELNVESFNPDPKRRQLSSLLDDADMLKNLSHILGYIEFNDEEKRETTKVNIMTTKEKHVLESVTVDRESFWNLKDSSMLSLSLHPGVRILNYLQQILFKKEEASSGEEEMKEIEKVDNGVYEGLTQALAGINEARRMRNDVISFLKRMDEALTKMSLNKDSMGKAGNAEKALPINNKEYLHKLIVVPKMNASSSLAVATTSVACLMHNYGGKIQHSYEVRSLLMKDATMFFALYGFNIPTGDTNVSKRIVELLKEGCVQLLVALSYFDYPKTSYDLQLTLLNMFCVWSKEQVEDIKKTYNEDIDKIQDSGFTGRTIALINMVADLFKNNIPVNEFSPNTDRIFVFKNGYGFFAVDEIKKVENGWSYVYHHPRYERKIDRCSAAKFKGFKEIQ